MPLWGGVPSQLKTTALEQQKSIKNKIFQSCKICLMDPWTENAATVHPIYLGKGFLH